MASTLGLSGLLHAGRRGVGVPSSAHHYLRQQLRRKHQVRVILIQDLPEGQKRGVYAGEVHNVAAGYARNYLIPKKFAVYASPTNFERCGMVDPDIASKEEASHMIGEEENEDLKAADLLRRYLRNKTVKIIRNVDPNLPTMCHPGHVSAKNLRDKLSKQLKIDLEDHETIHIRRESVVGLEEKEENELMELIKNMDEDDFVAKTQTNLGGETDEEEGGHLTANEEASDGDDSFESQDASEESNIEATATAGEADTSAPKDCDTKLKQLGEYVAKITLAGGYIVPLKFQVVRR
ncbi:hypothetical protein ACHAWF_018773 [Thalassiosira exigua]